MIEVEPVQERDRFGRYWKCEIDGHRHATKSAAHVCLNGADDIIRKSADLAAENEALRRQLATLGGRFDRVSAQIEALAKVDNPVPGGQPRPEGMATHQGTVSSGTDWADPGYRPDGVRRLPISTPAQIRQSWGEISRPEAEVNYTPMQLANVRSRIRGAWVVRIDPSGPPAAKSSAIGITGQENPKEQAEKAAAGAEMVKATRRPIELSRWGVK